MQLMYLNSNIEIHKCNKATIQDMSVKDLNSNIEIHKSSIK